MAEDIMKKYSNDDITVVWQANRCIHSTNCWKTLLPVFNPNRRPWIDMTAALTDDIIQTVDNCPSKALSYYKNNDSKKIK
jgi:uncharacterized Fe-S cluster protein YjdI